MRENRLRALHGYSIRTGRAGVGWDKLRAELQMSAEGFMAKRHTREHRHVAKFAEKLDKLLADANKKTRLPPGSALRELENLLDKAVGLLDQAVRQTRKRRSGARSHVNRTRSRSATHRKVGTHRAGRPQERTKARQSHGASHKRRNRAAASAAENRR